MRPAIAALVIGALSVSAQVSVHVQTLPSARPPQTEQSVTVEGCVHGKHFRPDVVDGRSQNSSSMNSK